MAEQDAKKVKVVRPKAKPAVQAAPNLAASKVNIYSIDGDVKGEVGLPEIFEEEFRPDLIHRAVVAAQSNRRQVYSPSPMAGLQHSVSWPGKGRGMARTPRLNHGGGKGAQAPNTVGGRRAHPPRTATIYSKKMNRKEHAKALRSAIAATSKEDMVKARGHIFREGISLPVIVDEAIEKLASAKNEEKNLSPVKKGLMLIDKLGLQGDIDRAEQGTHIRAGRGKARGRKYRTPKSILVVVANKADVAQCFKNLPGVDVVSVREMGVEHLAPGGSPGRLVLMSTAALRELGKGGSE